MDVIPSIDKLDVSLNGRAVGRLAWTDKGVCAFEYEASWIANGFSISPLELPLRTGVFMAKRTPFYGNFGIFEDSLPDGYGRYLLNRLLRRQGIDELTLTPLQRLSIVGDSGMGALCYAPAATLSLPSILPALNQLQQLALDVLAEKTDEQVDVLYFNSGNSGGCRPKCLYRDEQGEWLVKFRHTYDPPEMGQMEFHYNEVASSCGIQTPDFKLIDGKYFSSRRFDRLDGRRLHTATAGALLGESLQQPKMDYKTLLSLTGFLTQDPMAVDEMFRRMAFNILTDNKDDHPKNFAFIRHDNGWRLAPAYDLTYSPAGFHGEHATSVNYHGKPSLSDLLVVGEGIRIPRTKALKMISQVEAACRQGGILMNPLQ